MTSVLSKRWRNLFAFLPILDIDDSVFLHPLEGTLEREDNLQTYVDFVDRVLALKGDYRIENFSLKWKSGVDPNRVNQWICNVLQNSVLNMDVFIHLGTKYRLPSEMFMCKTLVKLKLGILEHPFDLRISLPKLKTLVLESVWFLSGQLQMLLSACPALEELDMAKITLYYGSETVSSVSLKTLTIKSPDDLRAFSFDTPDLVCLKYSVVVPYDYPLINLQNLVEAHIELILTHDTIRIINNPFDNSLRNEYFLRPSTVHKLVRGIRNVQKLYLSPGSLQVLALCRQAMPVFNNLTFLGIESRLFIAWQAMPVLIRSCPHLETLVVKGLLHHVTNDCGDSCNCVSREEKGTSLMSCPVKRLEIQEFEGITRELEMIKHFLDYLSCLEEMEIFITDSPPKFQVYPLKELNPEMLMRYNDLSGRSPNVKFMVHGSLPCTSQ